MRATASHDTVIEGAFVPDQHVIRVIEARFCRRRRRSSSTIFVPLRAPMIANIYIGLAPSGHAIWRSRGIKTKRFGRAFQMTRLDGLPPGGAADDRRYRHRAGGHDRACRPNCRKIGPHGVSIAATCAAAKLVAAKYHSRQRRLPRRSIRQWTSSRAAECSREDEPSEALPAMLVAAASTRRMR